MRGGRSGAYLLHVRAGDANLTLALHVGDRLANLADARPAAASVEAVTIEYPRRELAAFGVSFSWLPAFLVLTLAFTLLFRPLFRVTL